MDFDFKKACESMAEGKKVTHISFEKGYYLYKRGDEIWKTVGSNLAKNPGRKWLPELSNLYEGFKVYNPK